MEDRDTIILTDEDGNQGLFTIEREFILEDGEVYAILQQIDEDGNLIGDPIAFRVLEPESDTPILEPIEDEELLNKLEQMLNN